MTAMKINRINLNEIDRVTFRCRNCRASITANIDGERFGASTCPSCGTQFGNLARDVFEGLQSTCAAAGMSEKFDVEFDIKE